MATNKDIYEALEGLRKEVKADYKSLEEDIDKTYAKLVAFEPVRNIAFGLVGAIGLAVLAAVMKAVLR